MKEKAANQEKLEKVEKPKKGNKIIQAVIINDQDKKKRYWIVPDELHDVKIKVGMEAVVQTVNGLRRVRITGGYWSPNKTVRWNGGRIKITQEVVMYYED